ncbi:hypothetical protein [Longispora albida]|uniref:hypothetical protein n=1 Tax=Longispora albida TaxID=203523 RepID=UPI000375B1CC
MPEPGTRWAETVAALLDGFDIVITATGAQVPAGLAGKLAARARQRGSVLVPYGRWPGADLTLEAGEVRWACPSGTRLTGAEAEVVARGRGPASRPVRDRVTLPGGEPLTSGLQQRPGLRLVGVI